MQTTTLAPAAVFAPAGRDRVTVYVIAVAVAALLVVPWAVTGGPSALLRAVGGDVSLWPLITASLIALACAYKELDRGTAVAAGFAVVWALGSVSVTV